MSKIRIINLFKNELSFLSAMYDDDTFIELKKLILYTGILRRHLPQTEASVTCANCLYIYSDKS